LASKGYSLHAFAGHIEVPFSTVLNWRRLEPEFKEACEIADGKRHLFFEETALQNLGNKFFNANLFGRLAQSLGQKMQEPVETEKDVEIEPSQMTPDQRQRRILELQGQVKIG
jgi:hypothetical protein